MAPKFKDPDDQIPVSTLLLLLLLHTSRLIRFLLPGPQCTSPAQLSAHIAEMQTLFLKPESEHTWESFGKSLNKCVLLLIPLQGL